MEKALPSGWRKANMAGTPGPAQDLVRVHAGASKLGVGGGGVDAD